LEGKKYINYTDRYFFSKGVLNILLMDRGILKKRTNSRSLLLVKPFSLTRWLTVKCL